MAPKGDKRETRRRAPRVPRVRPSTRADGPQKRDRRDYLPPAADEISAREREDPGFLRAFLERLYRVCLKEHEQGKQRERAQRDLDNALRKFRAVLFAEHSPGERRRQELEAAALAGVEHARAELFVLHLPSARRRVPSEIETFDRLVEMLPKLRPTMSADRQFVRHALRYATLPQIADALGTTVPSVRQIKSALRNDAAREHTRVIGLAPGMVLSVDAEKIKAPDDPREWPDDDDTID